MSKPDVTAVLEALESAIKGAFQTTSTGLYLLSPITEAQFLALKTMRTILRQMEEEEEGK